MCLPSLLLFVADFTRQLQRLAFQAGLSRFIFGIRMDLILPETAKKKQKMIQPKLDFVSKKIILSWSKEPQ